MREKGVASFSGSIEPQASLPIDARMLVPTKEDLILESTWAANDGNIYAYKGMIVSVVDDVDSGENGVYWLMELPFNDELNWNRIGSLNEIDLELQEGKSAYQVWLDNGNIGTEEDFINYLKGQKGDKGDKGDSGLPGPGFKPDAIGSLEDRSNYDGENEGFCYLVIEESALYFRRGISDGLWVGPLTFIDYGEVKRQARKQALIFG